MLDISRSVERITGDLIIINSVSGNEKEICDEIEAVFEQYDVETFRVGNSFTARLDYGKKKTIALVGHLDTVPPCRDNHLDAKFNSGNVYGLGASDMKNGLACMLKVLYDIKQGTITPKYNIVFVFYDGEETSLPNGITRLLAENKLNGIDFAYVLEPTNSKYSVGCLGSITAKFVVPGFPNHSANPRDAVNGLLEAVKIIKKVERVNARIYMMHFLDSMKFYETINVTQVSTENAENVVPGIVRLTINYRFAPKKKIAKVKKLLFSVIDEKYMKEISISDACIIPPEKFDGFLFGHVEREIMQGWSDMAQLNAANIPAVNFGAGDMKLAHNRDDNINVEKLNKFYELLKIHI